MTDAATLAALEAVRELMQNLANGDDAELRDAPELDHWHVFQQGPELGLIGWVTGHPILGDNRWVRTSALVVMAGDESWARTLNRFYRLKRPFGARET